MVSPFTAILIALIGGPVLAVVAYYLTGSIRTSTADRLWAEAGRIRDDLTARCERLEQRTAALELIVASRDQRIANLESDLGRLREENARQAKQIEKLEFENTGLRQRIAELEAKG